MKLKEVKKIFYRRGIIETVFDFLLVFTFIVVIVVVILALTVKPTI